MKITRQWFAQQMRRHAMLAADPSAHAQEQIEIRLQVLEASVAAILQRLEAEGPRPENAASENGDRGS